MDIVLYSDQEDGVEALREGFRQGYVNQMFCLPTGGGKTVVASFLIEASREKGTRSLFMVDRIPLVDQTSATFDRYGIPHGVIQAQHWRSRPWERAQVASIQTLARRAVWPEAGLYFVDEAHCMYATVSTRIVDRKVRTIGLSATPFVKGLGVLYDRVVCTTTTNALIQAGRLASYEIFAPSQPDMKGVKVKAGEWEESETAGRAMPIIGDCVATYMQRGGGKKFIAFGVNVAHCEEMQKQFLSAGINCALYTYRTGDEERGRMVEEFRKPDSYIRGLISVAALSKGFDVPSVGVVILARPLRSSLAEHVQQIGRGMRPDPDDATKVLTILDHAGNCERMWPEMNEFFETGVQSLDDGTKKESKPKERPEKKPAKCPQCKNLHKPAPQCPACGFAYAIRNGVLHVPGELSLVGGSVSSREDKQALYSQLLFIARSRAVPRSPGWVAHKCKERCGVWPRNLSETPQPPTPDLMNWVRSRDIAWARSQAARKGRAA